MAENCRCQFVLSPAFCRNLGENSSVSATSKLPVLLMCVQGELEQPLGAGVPHCSVAESL